MASTRTVTGASTPSGIPSKHEARYDIGYSFALWPESRMYKRWFDFPDLGKKGW